MASSAAHLSVTNGASIHAPHGKTYNKSSQDSGGDNFADMLAGAGAQEESARADTRQTSSAEKTAPAEKPAAGSKTAAKNDEATDQTAPDGVQAEAPPTDATADAGENIKFVADVTPGADGKSENSAANDNPSADVIAALPQTAPSAPAPQPVSLAALAVPTQTAAQDAAPNTAASEASDAGVAPIANAANTPVKAAPQIPRAGNPAPADEGGNEAPPDASQAVTGQAATAKPAQEAAIGDFGKVLQETDTAQPGTASPDAAKPVETAPFAAARPSPEINNIALTAPAAPTLPVAAPQVADKSVMTAHAEAPLQAVPDVNQFAVDIAARSQSGAKQFDIRLDPPELGRVEVRLSINVHGKAEAHLTADQPQTLELLQKDAPALARALREAGLNVAQDALNFSLKNQQQHAGGDEQSRHGARGSFGGPRNSNETGQQDEVATTRRSLGLLDIRV